MKPTLGRIVHYRATMGWRSAMVVQEEPFVLRAFSPGHDDWDIFDAREGDEYGCWRWPPRVAVAPDPRVDQSAFDRGRLQGFEDARHKAAAIALDQARLAEEHQERGGGHIGDDEVHGQAKAQALTIARRIGEMKP